MASVLTTFLSRKPEPQGKDQVLPNDHERIKLWAQSIKGKAQGVIFHDQLSSEFIKHYPHLYFEKVDDYPWSPNDGRYFIFRNYLLTRPEIEDVFISDLFDVKINQIPQVGEKLIIQNEGMKWHGNPWSRRLFNRVYGKSELKRIMGKEILNAGLWGGKRIKVLKVLDLMIAEFNRLKVGEKNANMAVFNSVIYDLNEEFLTGYPYHSEFKKYQVNSKACFIHK